MTTSKYVPMINEIMRDNPTIRLWDCAKGLSYDSGDEIDSIQKIKGEDWIGLEQLYVNDDEIEDMNEIKLFTTNHSYKDVYNTLKKYITTGDK
jgi:hypothetical protein